MSQNEKNGNFDRLWRDQKVGNKTLSEAEQSGADFSAQEALVHFSNGILCCLDILMCVAIEEHDIDRRRLGAKHDPELRRRRPSGVQMANTIDLRATLHVPTSD